MIQGNRMVQFLCSLIPALPILSHEDVKSFLWAIQWLAHLIFLPLTIFLTFVLDHPQLPFLSYDNLFSFG
jgi:hypothetical protein